MYQVRYALFCIIEKNSSIRFLRVAAEKIKAGGAAEQSKTFIKFSGNRAKIVIFCRAMCYNLFPIDKNYFFSFIYVPKSVHGFS